MDSFKIEVGIYCFFKTHDLSDFVCTACHWTPTLRSCKGASWTAWYFQKICYLCCVASCTALQNYCKLMLFFQKNTFPTCIDHVPFVTCNMWLSAPPTFQHLRWGPCWPADLYMVSSYFYILRDAIKGTVHVIDSFSSMQCSWQLRTVNRRNQTLRYVYVTLCVYVLTIHNTLKAVKRCQLLATNQRVAVIGTQHSLD